jgi:hypothetical protein
MALMSQAMSMEDTSLKQGGKTRRYLCEGNAVTLDSQI